VEVDTDTEPIDQLAPSQPVTVARPAPMSARMNANIGGDAFAGSYAMPE